VVSAISVEDKGQRSMVAQRESKRQSVLAWSFEHTLRGREIMIDDDYHIGKVILFVVYGSLVTVIDRGRDDR